MTKISNIDAIVELILTEARARKGPALSVRIYNVASDVDRRVGEIMSKYSHEERMKQEADRKAEWAKGM